MRQKRRGRSRSARQGSVSSPRIDCRTPAGEDYYLPLLERVAELRISHGSDPACAAILDSCEHEAEIYRKYKRYYGYTFFVMQVI